MTNEVHGTSVNKTDSQFQRKKINATRGSSDSNNPCLKVTCVCVCVCVCV